jgi:hypothetical protein
MADDKIPLASLPADFLPPASFADRLYSFGDPAIANVEDHRGEPDSGYAHMKANIDLVGAMMRHFFPEIKNLDFPKFQPRYLARQPGQLSAQAGYYDIPHQTQR